MFNLEVCVDTAESAIIAEKSGATRLELCSNLIIGGTTPSIDLLDIVKKNVNIPIHVIIRPRFGDFCYSELEFEEIKRNVISMKEHGADGVVIGILNPDGSLDKERLKILIELAKPLHITLHRAFDVCNDPFRALQDAKDLGMDTILTSGQKQTVLEGAKLISQLIKVADNEIDIMLGSGVGSDTIIELIEKTHAKSYHMAGRIKKESSMIYRAEGIPMGFPILSEYDLFQTSGAEIKKTKELISNYLK